MSTRPPQAAPAAPKRLGRPPGTGLPAGEQKTIATIRLGPDDRANLALARHLFDARNDSDALRRALEWAVLDAGEHLTAEQRARILGA